MSASNVIALIHGYGFDSRIWDPVEIALDGFQVIKFSLPGFGIGAPHGPYTIESLAKTYWHALDEQNILAVHLVGHSAHRFRGTEHRILDVDGTVHTKRQCQRVTGAGVDTDQPAVLFEPDHSVEGVFLQFAYDHLLYARLEPREHRADQVMRHGAWCRDLFDLEGDGVCFVDADPDGQDRAAVDVLEDHDRHIRDGIHH